MRSHILNFSLILLLSSHFLPTAAQDQAVRDAILKKLDAFKTKSLAISKPSTSFDDVNTYQRDLYNMFLQDDVVIEAGVKSDDKMAVPIRVYRADELGAWLRSLSRSQNINLQSIDFQQIEIYWLESIEKVSEGNYRLYAYVLPWDRIAYREGDFRTMPGVKKVSRQMGKRRLEAIMASGEEIFIGYLKMVVLDRQMSDALMRRGNSGNETIHTVQPGETLFSIAMKHKVEIGDIMADNNLSGTKINKGQNLIINRNPVPQQQAASRLPGYLSGQEGVDRRQSAVGSEDREEKIAFRPLYYTIREGENARRVAERHKLDYEQLLEWNPYAEFRVGEKVIVDMLAVE